MRFPPATIQLRRAQLILMLVALIPTLLMTAVGIILLVFSNSKVADVVSGVLVLAFCTSGIIGYILTSIFVGKGASLVRVQNDFVSSVSHELRTPLTSIHLLIDSLGTGRLEDAERAQVLSLLGRETLRLEALVSKVLELSKLQSSYVYARERIDLATIIDEAIAAFDAITLSKPTPIARRLESGLVIVGDHPTLVSLVVNLLTNAWKYTGDDKRIELEAHASGRWVELLVRDNGIGIERDEQRSIFEQFSRGRAAHENGAQGVGLGLSFVRAIVRGHRGKIDLTSRAGETEFRVRLRRGREVAPAVSHVPARQPT